MIREIFAGLGVFFLLLAGILDFFNGNIKLAMLSILYFIANILVFFVK